MFPKSPDYKYVSFVIHEGKRHHVSQTTTLGAPPPLILGFRPSKRHAALIARSDQDSMALTWMKTLALGVAMRQELLFARRDDALLHE